MDEVAEEVWQEKLRDYMRSELGRLLARGCGACGHVLALSNVRNRRTQDRIAEPYWSVRVACGACARALSHGEAHASTDDAPDSSAGLGLLIRAVRSFQRYGAEGWAELDAFHSEVEALWRVLSEASEASGMGPIERPDEDEWGARDGGEAWGDDGPWRSDRRGAA